MGWKKKEETKYIVTHSFNQGAYCHGSGTFKSREKAEEKLHKMAEEAGWAQMKVITTEEVTEYRGPIAYGSTVIKGM